MQHLLCFQQRIPTLVNRYDRSCEIILRDLKAKVPQVRSNIVLRVCFFFVLII